MEDDEGKIVFRAVIDQAFKDAIEHSNHKQSEVIGIDRECARQWLTRPSRDFETVCQLAEMDSATVRRAAHRLARSGWLRREARVPA